MRIDINKDSSWLLGSGWKSETDSHWGVDSEEKRPRSRKTLPDPRSSGQDHRHKEKGRKKKQEGLSFLPGCFMYLIELLHEFNDCHWSSVATTDTCFNYTSVSTVTVFISWTNFVEELL